MEKENAHMGQMEACLQGTGRAIYQPKVSLCSQMERAMKVIGKMISSLGLGRSALQTETIIKENGGSISLTGMA